MPNPLKGKTTKVSKSAPYRESSEADVKQALERMRGFPGLARIDGHQMVTGFLRLDWRGLSHPGGGILVTTRSWERYTEVYKLAAAALDRRAHQPIRKPAASAPVQTVVPSQRKRR